MCSCSPPMTLLNWHGCQVLIHSPKAKSNWKNNNNTTEVGRNREVTGDGRRRARAPRRAAKPPGSESHAQRFHRLRRLWKSKHSAWFQRWSENPRVKPAVFVSCSLYPTGAWSATKSFTPPLPSTYILLSVSQMLTDIDWWLMCFWLWCTILIIFIYFFFCWLLFLSVWAYPPFPHYAPVMFPAQTSSDMVVASKPSKVGMWLLPF